MAWQDVFPVSSPRIAAEEDRELRLAIQARAGAEWALTALVARYQPPVTRYLTRLTGDAALARALAERVFVRMERRLHGPEGGRHLRLWLLRASTEAGLDALRHPPSGRAASRLAGPTRPMGLLADAGGQRAMHRLKAGLGALAQATAQTRRQVRKLVWSTAPDAAEKPADFERLNHGPFAHEAADGRDAGHAPAVEESAAEQDPREALRARIVRAVLAELPYGDAQCLALHLVAGLNQAEVATALGLANSATRRRIVQGLQLFAQRFNAAAASLGISPEALAELESGPLGPVAAGYDPVPEPADGRFVPSFGLPPADPLAAYEAPAESASPMAVPAEEPGIVEADAFVVEALPLALPVAPVRGPEEAEQEAEPDQAEMGDDESVAAGDDAAEAELADYGDQPAVVSPLAADAAMVPSEEVEPEAVLPEEATSGPALATVDDVTVPRVAAVVAELAAAPDDTPDDTPDGPASPSESRGDGGDAPGMVVAPATGLIPPLAPAPRARLIPVTTPAQMVSQAESPSAAVEMAAPGPAPEARLIPVLTPQARQRVDTVPLSRRREPIIAPGAGASGRDDG